MAIFIFSEPIYEWYAVKFDEIPADNSAQLDSMKAKWTWSKPPDPIKIPAPLVRFKFDPNTVSTADLIRLGVSQKLADRIVRYRTKGGRFRIQEDFGKIYGMDSSLARKLEAFISLPKVLPPRSRIFAGRDSAKFPVKARTRESFDLNLADSTQLIGIYGIGSRLSKRILAYRSRLGGFISMAQLHEVYGLDTAVIGQLQKRTFIAPDFLPKKININHAGKKELTTLPYIRFTLANAITTWRFQHGDFLSVEELRQIAILDEVTFEKIKPYLTVKE